MGNRIAFFSARVESLCCAALAGTVLLLGLTTFTHGATAQETCPQNNSGGTPVVHSEHIFCGEINKSGKAVGFHSRPGGKDPDTVSDTTDRRSRLPVGIYRLYNFNIKQDKATDTKIYSTMFPDKCSHDDVVNAIQYAVTHRTNTGDPFEGPSGPSCRLGTPAADFTITGHIKDGVVTTAYPVSTKP